MADLKIEGITATGKRKRYAAGDTIAPSLETVTLPYVIDNNGSVLAAGEVRGFPRIPFKGTITKVTLLVSPGAATLTVDIWKDTYANFPPTNGDSICASAKPTITVGNKYEDSTLTGWTTAVAAGDVLRFEIEGTPLVVTEATVILEIKKTT